MTSGVKLILCYNLEITLGHLPHLAPLHKLVSLAHLPEGLKYGMAAGARIFLPWATFDLIGHRLILMTVPGQKALDHNTFLHGVCHGGVAMLVLTYIVESCTDFLHFHEIGLEIEDCYCLH